MSDTGLREDIERLKRVFERELEAQVEVEEVDPDRFRITVV